MKHLLCALSALHLCMISPLAQTSWVENGTAKAVIVLPDNAFPVATYAAEELAFHIELATGAKLKTVRESEIGNLAPETPRIFVGVSSRLKEEGVDVTSLKPEETRIFSKESDFFIAGNDSDGDPLDLEFIHSGTLWGVYEILQRTLDVRWLWPGNHGIDFRPTSSLQSPVVDMQFSPHFLTRSLRTYTIFRKGQPDPIILITDRNVAQEAGLAYSSREEQVRYVRDERIFLRRQRMGQSQPYNYTPGHDFVTWWPKYGKEHPDWFQLIPEEEGEFAISNQAERVQKAYDKPRNSWKGRRGPADPNVPELISMNVSHPGLHQEIIKLWKEQRAQSPGVAVPVSVGENDIWALDLSEESVALDAPQLPRKEAMQLPGSASGQYYPFDAGRRYAWFYRRIHELASAVDPDAIVNGYVYLNYFNAPTDIKLSPNVILAFTPWGGWYYPRDPKAQAWLKDQWNRWTATGARLLFRPNFTLDGGSMPLNYQRQMGEEFQYFTEKGCIGADYDFLNGQWAAQGATLYVLVGQLSRPELSVDELLSEFYGAFGPGAKSIQAYYDFWESYAQKRRDHWIRIMERNGASNLLTYSKAAHELFPTSALDEAESFLQKAEEETKDAPRYAERVAFVRHGLTHARKSAALSAVFAKASATDEEKRAAIEDIIAFRRSVEALNVANFSVSGADEIRSYGEKYDFGAKSKTEAMPADVMQ